MNRKMSREKQRVLVLMTGGTIAQAVDDSGRMQIKKSVAELISAIETDAELATHQIDARTGADLSEGTVREIIGRIQASPDDYDGFVVITGTDSMEELAYLLDVCLQVEAPVVLTGAMKPSDIIGYDGLANLGQAVTVAASPQSRNRGVLLVMNDDIHLARLVRKVDSQLIGAFRSHPGPVGQIRRGTIYYYFNNDRNPESFDISRIGPFITSIPILTFAFGMPFPKSLLNEVDGLVIAGMGTSSISKEWISLLSEHTSRLPVVLVSRCITGTNYDDSYYRGSLIKYEELGFHLSDFVELNPMQARIKLMLQLSEM